jgi:hypothetical protein
MKTTIKIFKALALGIPIVSDNWISRCAALKELLPHERFIARDSANERKWKTSNDWSAGGKSRSSLFQDFTITTTEELKATYGTSTFKQLKEVCGLMGAKEVVCATSVKNNQSKGAPKVIYLASECKDNLVEQFKRIGAKVYSKDLLNASIFRGVLDLESDEFVL